jgi:hypothetical protein
MHLPLSKTDYRLLGKARVIARGHAIANGESYELRGFGSAVAGRVRVTPAPRKPKPRRR